MITQELMIDVNDKGAETIFSRVGEEDTREIVVTPISYVEGEPRPIIFDTENPTALFRMVKPDGTFVVKAMTRFSPESIVKFSVVLSGAMSQVAGVGYYDIRIYEEDSPDFIYTVQGQFQIDDDMITDSMIESVAEANGFVFPDDFLTSADLDDYATKEYTDTAIEEAISEIDVKHTYSETEHIVGTWINNKPIYEKTFLVPANFSPSSNYHDYAHGIANIDEIIDVQSMVVTNNTDWWPGNAFRPGLQNGVLTGANGTNIRWINSWLSPINKFHVTLQYTKTTD